MSFATPSILVLVIKEMHHNTYGASVQWYYRYISIHFFTTSNIFSLAIGIATTYLNSSLLGKVVHLL